MQTLQRQASDARLHIGLLSVQSEMVRYLGVALRDLRKARKIKLIEIAYPLRKSEAAMSRFEGGRVRQPEAIDVVVDAYARELELEPFEIWAEALKRWREATTETAGEARADAAAALESELGPAARRRAAGAAKDAQGKRAGRQRRAS